jgi:hypothetical protein
MVSFKWLSLGRPAMVGEHERSLAEKSLVRRLDIFLMTFGCISQGRLSLLNTS